MISIMFNRIELAFWDTVIFLLDEVGFVRWLVHQAYQFSQTGSLQRYTAATLKVSLAGFLSGVSFFIFLKVLS